MNEHNFIKNICLSLVDDGACIVGIPSLESQAYASEGSKRGHMNCKTGPDFKIFLSDYFFRKH